MATGGSTASGRERPSSAFDARPTGSCLPDSARPHFAGCERLDDWDEGQSMGEQFTRASETHADGGTLPLVSDALPIVAQKLLPIFRRFSAKTDRKSTRLNSS